MIEVLLGTQRKVELRVEELSKAPGNGQMLPPNHLRDRSILRGSDGFAGMPQECRDRDIGIRLSRGFRGYPSNVALGPDP